MFPRLARLLARGALIGALVGAALPACSSKGKAQALLDCSEHAPAPEGLNLDSAREAYRRAAMRRELRVRETLEPGYLMKSTRAIADQSAIDRGQRCYEELYTVGRLLFEHEYGFADGLGRDDASRRPDPFRKVHEGELGGPETTSCTSCHWRGGPAGAGAVQDNALLFGDGTNTSSADARNPPALQGSGVVQALAQEMSSELQEQMALGMIRARDEGERVTVSLSAKDIDFGLLHIEPTGMLDTSELRGVDADLIIKPFGWRGEFASLRDFVMTSTQVHLGIQSEDLLRVHGDDPKKVGAGPAEDPDGDGVLAEMSSGQLTALIVYLASLELPVIAAPEVLREFPAPAEGLNPPLEHNFYDRFSEGQRLFADIGCASCHTPVLVLKNPIFKTRSAVSGASYAIDLSRQSEAPRLVYNDALGGYPVWLFSDMRRHDLGEEAAGKHALPGQSPSSYLTRRLWGLAGSPPYFYDGRAPTLDGAIASHGGEAAFAREGFDELTAVQKGSLRIYLLSLRRSPRLVVP